MSTIKSSAENLTLNADGANNDIKFQSNGSEVASIDQAGSLVLSGNITAGNNGSIFLLDNAGQKSGEIQTDSSAANALQIDADPDNSASGSYIGLRIDNSERMRIDSSGKVGIGTSNPSSKFHLYDGSAVDAFKVENYNRGVIWNSVGSGGMYSEYQLQGTAKFRMGQSNHLVSGASTANFAMQYSGDLLFSSGTTERMRILANGGLTFNGDTAAANALDDYEEGTFVPKMGDNSTTMANVYRASYVKVGKLITLDIDVMTPSYSGANQHYIMNLPFASGNNGNGGGCVGYVDASDVVPTFHLTGASTTLYFLNLRTGNVYNLSNKRLIFSMVYHIP